MRNLEKLKWWRRLIFIDHRLGFKNRPPTSGVSGTPPRGMSSILNGLKLRLKMCIRFELMNFRGFAFSLTSKAGVPGVPEMKLT